MRAELGGAWKDRRTELQALSRMRAALERTPSEVRTALGTLYPEVDPAAMDVPFAAEKGAWRMRPVTAADMKQELDFMVASGASIPGLDRIDPARMLYAPHG